MPPTNTNSVCKTRSKLLYMGSLLGELSSAFGKDAGKATTATLIVSLISTLLGISDTLSINLHEVLINKLAINDKKYPPRLCKGKPAAIKYTEYSHETGITKEHGQSVMKTAPGNREDITIENANFMDNIKDITLLLVDFVTKREWTKDDTPTNLMMATMGEYGELVQLFAWKGDDPAQDQLTSEEKDKVAQEIADVTILSLRLAYRCGIDL